MDCIERERALVVFECTNPQRGRKRAEHSSLRTPVSRLVLPFIDCGVKTCEWSIIKGSSSIWTLRIKDNFPPEVGVSQSLGLRIIKGNYSVVVDCTLNNSDINAIAKQSPGPISQLLESRGDFPLDEGSLSWGAHPAGPAHKAALGFYEGVCVARYTDEWRCQAVYRVTTGCLLEDVQNTVVSAKDVDRSLDFGSELEIAQVQILSVTVALFISTINLVLYRLSPLFCLTRSSHRPVAHEDGYNKA
ncbi:hypothetical protein J6590_013410 [Homalodisca vitripennis]|nr:hypothetical protein J6590_013410 [Homalodisca vitripennis]